MQNLYIVLWKSRVSPGTTQVLTLLADSFSRAGDVFETVMEGFEIAGIVRKDEKTVKQNRKNSNVPIN